MTNPMVVSDGGFTGWFPSAVEPTRKGVYQVRSTIAGANPLLAKWDGCFWRDAFHGHIMFSREWRGLTYDEYLRLAANVSSKLISEFAIWC